MWTADQWKPGYVPPGTGSGPYSLLLQNDGNLVLTGAQGAVWASDTVLSSTTPPPTSQPSLPPVDSPTTRPTSQPTDGSTIEWNEPANENVCFAPCRFPLNGKLVNGDAKAVLQGSDGNFVLYYPAGSPVYSSKTSNQGVAALTLTEEGQLALVNQQQSVVLVLYAGESPSTGRWRLRLTSTGVLQVRLGTTDKWVVGNTGSAPTSSPPTSSSPTASPPTPTASPPTASGGGNANCQVRKGTKCVNVDRLDYKVMFGYQGWFRIPGFPFPKHSQWGHWTKEGVEPRPDTVTFDLWPDQSEYPAECKKEAPQLGTMKDGSTATLFSSACEGVVDAHFRWMHDYGLDGVFLQRFIASESMINQKGAIWDHRNRVTELIMKSTTDWGRTWAMMYDISGKWDSDAQVFATLQKDFLYLKNTLKIFESPNYLHHHGKPVLTIWGVGFNDNNDSGRPPKDAATCVTWVKWFKDQGFHLMGGVPFHWESSDPREDSRANFRPCYDAFDTISPWSVGRWRDTNSLNSAWSMVASGKRAADSMNKGFSPVLFPGFSWFNLKDLGESYFNDIPRRGGDFFNWQADKAMSLMPQFIYLAMFDEVDEATAFFVSAATQDDLPSNGKFLHLSQDGRQVGKGHYLALAGQLTKKFHAKANFQTDWVQDGGLLNQPDPNAENPNASPEYPHAPRSGNGQGSDWQLPLLIGGIVLGLCVAGAIFLVLSLFRSRRQARKQAVVVEMSGNRQNHGSRSGSRRNIRSSRTMRSSGGGAYRHSYGRQPSRQAMMASGFSPAF